MLSISYHRIRNVASGMLCAAAFVTFLLGCGQAAIFGEPAEVQGAGIVQMYYTTDDGATYFADDANKLSPFDRQGKQAVRCYVFSCDDRKTEFVAYLERLTPEARKKIEDAQAGVAKPGARGVDIEMILIEGMEVKKPGDAKWVKRTTPDGEKVTQVSCPDGNSANLNIVLPED